ncbi:hypothetical protein F5Y05DRAFT_381584 [Hypoxylon sp. FL0543]|nr:hypothetical protein F5Y05DRAFT_381584 [Hypoxylon sp. FL0543]
MSVHGTHLNQPIHRLVRPRVSEDLVLVCAADMAIATWRTRRVSFGGAMGTLRSSIYMAKQWDILYVDRPLPLKTLSLIDAMTMKPIKTASYISRIAVNLDRLPDDLWKPLWCAVDNSALSHLILVTGSDRLRQHVISAASDEWGFRELPEEMIEEQEPALYQSGRRAIEIFNLSRRRGIHHRFVYEWGGQDGGQFGN